ncbi:hypothetical protein L6164_008084 [Bauhinia variegata]|uniref:Uncharacterized protein n=1 Tax=Bauhinia variegata TaxID=167791 RepID=A0ACB9PH52_BAUVA|nr:hypothetical protein L6164_008084 [Bauhinia variegata]
MWMVGYNGSDDFNIADHGRKLRPLIPRLHNNSSSTTSPSLSRFCGTDFFSQYHNLVADQQGKKDLNNSPVVLSSRWNPTPEQLRALEELYRRGTRTPSAEQIQHITAQLRRFGKIEGKNVFYWFQNHKARERQKRRRQMESAAEAGHPRDFDTLDKKDLGASKIVFEVEQTTTWAPSSNCSVLAEESISIQRAAKAAVAECRADGRFQFNEGELHQRIRFTERNATWHRMQLSCPPPPPAAATQLINTSPSNIATTTTVATRPMDPKLITHDLSFFISPHRANGVAHLNSLRSEKDHNCVESQTLQLFPLRSGDGSDNINQKETEISASAMNANLTPSQFFEFLPLKN